MKIFGMRLKELRQENNMTQFDLAQILNVRNTTVSEWEKGTHEPNQEIMIKLTEIFKVTAGYLLGLED